MQALLFVFVATFTGLSAIGVLVTQNIVRAAVWLLFTLAGTAGVFFLLGADFVAATQLIIYVGGILVLVVFGVMLTAQGPFITMRVGAAEWTIGLVVGLLLLVVLGVTTTITATRSTVLGGWRGQEATPLQDPSGSNNGMVLGQAFLGMADVTPQKTITGVPPGAFPSKEPDASEESGIRGVKLRVPARQPMGYLLPFEIVSVHLLVVLIGAAYLARAKRRREEVTA
jgi:NADH-quinone oxidoreductase subunit J